VFARQHQVRIGIGGFEVKATATEIADLGRKLREQQRNLGRASRFGRNGIVGVSGCSGRNRRSGPPSIHDSVTSRISPASSLASAPNKSDHAHSATLVEAGGRMGEAFG
jgi:hypothetical protein